MIKHFSAIVFGIVIGFFVLAALVAFLVYKCLRRLRKRDASDRQSLIDDAHRQTSYGASETRRPDSEVKIETSVQVAISSPSPVVQIDGQEVAQKDDINPSCIDHHRDDDTEDCNIILTTDPCDNSGITLVTEEIVDGISEQAEPYSFRDAPNQKEESTVDKINETEESGMKCQYDIQYDNTQSANACTVRNSPTILETNLPGNEDTQYGKSGNDNGEEENDIPVSVFETIRDPLISTMVTATAMSGCRSNSSSDDYIEIKADEEGPEGEIGNTRGPEEPIVNTEGVGLYINDSIQINDALDANDTHIPTGDLSKKCEEEKSQYPCKIDNEIDITFQHEKSDLENQYTFSPEVTHYTCPEYIDNDVLKDNGLDSDSKRDVDINGCNITCDDLTLDHIDKIDSSENNTYNDKIDNDKTLNADTSIVVGKTCTLEIDNVLTYGDETKTCCEADQNTDSITTADIYDEVNMVANQDVDSTRYADIGIDLTLDDGIKSFATYDLVKTNTLVNDKSEQLEDEIKHVSNHDIDNISAADFDYDLALDSEVNSVVSQDMGNMRKAESDDDLKQDDEVKSDSMEEVCLSNTDIDSAQVCKENKVTSIENYNTADIDTDLTQDSEVNSFALKYIDDSRTKDTEPTQDDDVNSVVALAIDNACITDNEHDLTQVGEVSSATGSDMENTCTADIDNGLTPSDDVHCNASNDIDNDSTEYFNYDITPFAWNNGESMEEMGISQKTYLDSDIQLDDDVKYAASQDIDNTKTAYNDIDYTQNVEVNSNTVQGTDSIGAADIAYDIELDNGANCVASQDITNARKTNVGVDWTQNDEVKNELRPDLCFTNNAGIDNDSTQFDVVTSPVTEIKNHDIDNNSTQTAEVNSGASLVIDDTSTADNDNDSAQVDELTSVTSLNIDNKISADIENDFTQDDEGNSVTSLNIDNTNLSDINNDLAQAGEVNRVTNHGISNKSPEDIDNDSAQVDEANSITSLEIDNTSPDTIYDNMVQAREINSVTRLDSDNISPVGTVNDSTKDDEVNSAISQDIDNAGQADNDDDLTHANEVNKVTSINIADTSPEDIDDVFTQDDDFHSVTYLVINNTSSAYIDNGMTQDDEEDSTFKYIDDLSSTDTESEPT